MAITSLIRRLAVTTTIAALAAVAVPAISHAADPTLNNQYSVGQITLNKKQGSVKITVSLPLAGIATIANNDEHGASQARTAGTGVVVLTLKPHGVFLKHLKKTGKGLIKFNISFTPDGGVTNTQSHKIALKYIKR